MGVGGWREGEGGGRGKVEEYLEEMLQARHRERA